MKTLYRFLVRSYVPPFLMTLLIGMFIFFIIFVFVYVDEIAGKGIDNWTLTQLLFYSFISNLPTAAPLAVLLSSIMTMGNLAENYELAALKSSGLSLLTIMRPLIVLIVFISAAIFIFSNYTMPYISLKAGRLLWDVRQKKPSFNVKPGIYYGGLDNYRIRVDEKKPDGESMKGIYIADHSRGQGNLVQLVADSGKMRTTHKGDFLEIDIYNATQYRQLLESEDHKKTRPFVQMKFKEQKIKIDLSELKMQKTNEELFKNNYQMMNLKQLEFAIDSFSRKEEKIKDRIFEQVYRNFTPLSNLKSNYHRDSTEKTVTLSSVLEKFTEQEKNMIYDRALESIRNSDSYLNSVIEHELQATEYNELRFGAEWHKKLTLPFTCLLLFFVGAPLGAIVRKGGLGLPVVISVVLFIIFHVVKTSLEKSYMEGAVDWFSGLWGSSLVFLPFGIWLTWMAASDSALFDSSSYRLPRWRKKSK